MSKCMVVWHCKIYVSYSICESVVVLLFFLCWLDIWVQLTHAHSYHFVDRDYFIEHIHAGSTMNWTHLLEVISLGNLLAINILDFYHWLPRCFRNVFFNLFYLIQSWLCIISQVSQPDLLAKVIFTFFWTCMPLWLCLALHFFMLDRITNHLSKPLRFYFRTLLIKRWVKTDKAVVFLCSCIFMFTSWERKCAGKPICAQSKY